MAVQSGLNNISGEIRKLPHNQNYTLLIENDQYLEGELSAKLDSSIFNQHVAGSSFKHDSEDIAYTGGSIPETNVESALNSNRSLITSNYATLDGRIDDADARIDNIIAQSGTSDTEVVDARQSTALGVTYPVLKDRFEAIESDLQVPDTTPFTTSASIDDLPVGSVEGKVSEFEAKGLSLVNSVENGDFSDGTTGWTGTDASLSANNNILTVTGNGGGISTQAIKIESTPIIANNKYFVYAKARVTNSSALSLKYSLQGTVSGALDETITTPIINTWYEIYGVLDTTVSFSGNLRVKLFPVYPDATTANGKVMEVDGNAGVHAVNMTALGIEDLTEAQMLDLVRSGYIDGLQSIMRPTVETVGKNKFDKSSVIYNQYFSSLGGLVSSVGSFYTPTYVPVKPNTQYTLSNSTGAAIAEYDSNKNFIRRIVTLPIITSENAKYIRISYSSTFNGNIETLQLEEGTTATAYEPYQSSKITADVALRRVPNGVADRIYESDGKLWLEKNVEEYVFSGEETFTSIYNSDPVSVFTLPELLGIKVGVFGMSGQYILEGKPEQESSSAASFTADNIGNSYNGFDSYLIRVIYPFDTDLATVQADLAGTKIHYQLATPEIIDLAEEGLLAGQLESFENGTVYNYSDTFHSPEVSFNVPSNTAAQIGSLLDSSNAQAKQIAEKANKEQEDWIEPTLLNGWVNYGVNQANASYHIDDFGVVHLRGTIKSGTTTQGTVIMQLPIGYRPDKNLPFVVMSNIGYNEQSGIEVTLDGNLVIGFCSSNSLLSFNGISFRAEG